MNKFLSLSILILALAGTVGCAKQNPVTPSVQSSSLAPAGPTFETWNTGIVNPMGIAADSRGNLYVADAGANRIMKFSPDGTLLAHWTLSGLNDASRNFYQVYGVAMDSSDNLYVADAGWSLILKYNSDGVLLDQWGQKGAGEGQFNYPFGVAVDAAGSLYAADSFNARVQKLAQGQTSFAQVAYTEGLLQNPVGIAVDNQGNILTADYNANRLVKYNEETGVSSMIGSTGSGPAQFSNPTHVLLDASGNIYVVDYNNNRVQKLNSNGAYVREWGTSGDSNWHLKNPVGAVISNGFLYVTDSGNHRIVKYSL